MWHTDDYMRSLKKTEKTMIMTIFGDHFVVYEVENDVPRILYKEEILREKSHKKGGQSSARFQANRECQMRDYTNLLNDKAREYKVQIVSGSHDLLGLIRDSGIIKIVSDTRNINMIIQESKDHIRESKIKTQDSFFESIIQEIQTDPDMFYIGPEVDEAPEWNTLWSILEKPQDLYETNVSCILENLTSWKIAKKKNKYEY